MADTIKIPGLKQPVPKLEAYAGGGVVLVLIVIYWRKKKNQAATGQPAGAGTGLASGGLLAGDTTGAYAWDGTYGNPSDPYSMDTSTGLTYGNEGYVGGYGPGGVIGTGNPPGSAVPGPPFSTNAAWSAYALQQLTTVASFDANAAAEALGLYLAGQELDRNQQEIVYASQAVAGPVPVAAASGYPPKLRTAKAPGKPKGPVFAHNPVGGLKAAAKAAGTTRPVGGKNEELDITWDKSDHATGYQVSIANLTAHRTALSPVTTAHTSYTARGLTRGDTFEVTVLAKPAEKGAKPAKTQVRT